MLNARLTRCNVCAEIPNLLASIDAKIAQQAMKMYQNMILLLNKPIEACLIEDLLHYKRILTFKYLNEDYASCYTVEMIASKIRSKTVGVNSDCDCTVSIFTTSTTTTLPPLNLIKVMVSSITTSIEDPAGYACSEDSDMEAWLDTTQEYDGFVNPGDTLYTNASGENVFIGGNNYRSLFNDASGTEYTFMVSSMGIITYIEVCGG